MGVTLPGVTVTPRLQRTLEAANMVLEVDENNMLQGCAVIETHKPLEARIGSAVRMDKPATETERVYSVQNPWATPSFNLLVPPIKKPNRRTQAELNEAFWLGMYVTNAFAQITDGKSRERLQNEAIGRTGLNGGRNTWRWWMAGGLADGLFIHSVPVGIGIFASGLVFAVHGVGAAVLQSTKPAGNNIENLYTRQARYLARRQPVLEVKRTPKVTLTK
jgi:hypothetical protein